MDNTYCKRVIGSMISALLKNTVLTNLIVILVLVMGLNAALVLLVFCA